MGLPTRSHSSSVDVFASPGWRTTGTAAANYLVAPAGWRPDLRDRFIDEYKLPKETQLINAPTSYVWIIGRTKTDGPPDYDAVHKVQAGFKLVPPFARPSCVYAWNKRLSLPSILDP